jgi:hypothetical protein
VTRSALFRLQNKSDARVRYRLANSISFVPDHAEYLGGGNNGLSRGDHMVQQRAAADLMQNLGALGLESRAFAGGHDDDAK